MRSFRFTSLFTALSLSFSALPVLKAGMSVTMDDLEGVIKSNPAFDSLFIDNLQFAPSGEANRLGRHYGALSGTAVGPYKFKARFASDEGSEFRLMAILHTDIIYEDADRKITDNPGETVSVRERLKRVELIDVSDIGPEDISRALDELFEGANSAGSSNAMTGNGAGNNSGSNPGGNSGSNSGGSPGSLGAGAFSNELKEGDRMFAGQYFCDDYVIPAKANQKIEVVFQPNGFVPVILSKKDGRYSSSAGRADGDTVNEQITFSYVTPKDASVIVQLVTRDEGESGSYQVRITLDGKTLTPITNGEGNGYVTVQ